MRGLHVHPRRQVDHPVFLLRFKLITPACYSPDTRRRHRGRPDKALLS